MKFRIYFLSLFILLIHTSCEEKNSKASVSTSSGKINALSVFVDNLWWKGEVGDSIRSKFASPVDGLPTEEPLYNIKQYDTKLFDGFMTNSRLILYIEKSDQKSFHLLSDKYAKPQLVAKIKASSVPEVIELLEQNEDVIHRKFKQMELAENQRRILKSLIKSNVLEDKFGIKLKISSAYQVVMNEAKFVWIRKEIPAGNSSLLVYEIPLKSSHKDQDPINTVIQLRDSIGKKHIQGKLEDTYMITEASYAPYQFNITLQGHPTWETKGTWELKNDFMLGPFIHYAIHDKKNQRLLCVEGFCYNPQSPKRDLMFELEAMIKSIQFTK